MRSVDFEPISLDSAKAKDFDYDGQSVSVFLAPEGHILDVSRDFRVSRGSLLFDAVVLYRGWFEKLGLNDSSVSTSDWWTPDKYPKGQLEVAEFDPFYGDTVKTAAAKIKRLANEHGFTFYLDPLLVDQYLSADREIAAAQNLREGTAKIPVAIIRAGLPALLNAGFCDLSHYIFIEVKRLNNRTHPGELAVGLRFDRNALRKLDGQAFVTREIAHATMSSLIAVDLALLSMGIQTTEAVWAGTAGVQQGYEVALMHKRLMENTFGRPTRIMPAKIYHTLSGGEHPYYIKDVDGEWGVWDGGDVTDLAIPPGLGFRLVWPERVEERHIDALTAAHPDMKGMVSVGEPVTLEKVLTLRQVAVNDLGLDRFAVGEALTGVKV